MAATLIGLATVAAACSGGNPTTDRSPAPTSTIPVLPSSPEPVQTATPENVQDPSSYLASIPLAEVLGNGKPTLAEFGWRDCIPCKQMKPILEELAVEYEGRVNVLIVEVYEHLDLTRQYGIMAIPSQIVFEGSGREVKRHVGVWFKDDIVAQLKKMGIQ